MSSFALLDLPGFLAGPGRAACADEDPETFFPYRGDVETVAAAKAICARCPLLRPCTAWGLTHYTAGVWGGLTEHERSQLQRRFGMPRNVLWTGSPPPEGEPDDVGEEPEE